MKTADDEKDSLLKTEAEGVACVEVSLVKIRDDEGDWAEAALVRIEDEDVA